MGGVAKKPKASHRTRYGQGSFKYLPGKQLWRARIELPPDENGNRVRLEATSKDEDAAWTKYLDLVERAKNYDASREAKDRTTVKQWLETWLEERKATVRPKTYTTERSALTRIIIQRLGKYRLSEITATEIKLIARWYKQDGRSTTTARYSQRIFQQALKEAKAEGYTIDDTALLAKRATIADNPREALSIEQATAILAQAATEPDGSRWVAALLQGMRQGECLGLTWDMIDFDKKIIDVSWQLQELHYEDREKDELRIPDGYMVRRLYGTYCLVRPKTASGQRLIPMVPWMEASLLQWRKTAVDNPHNLVWANTDGTPRRAKQDLTAWKKLQAVAGVQKGEKLNRKGETVPVYYVLHEARNTCATLLLEAGVDPEIIKAILGHSSIVTSRSYMRVNTEMTRQALEKVAHTLHLGASVNTEALEAGK